MPKKNNPGCNCCTTVSEPSVNCANLCSNANVPATLYFHDGVNTPLALPNIVSGSSCTWRACRLMTMTGSKIGCSGGSTGQVPVMISFIPAGVGGGYVINFQIAAYSFGGSSWETASSNMTCAQLTNAINGVSPTGCSEWDSFPATENLLVSDETGNFTVSSCVLGSFSASVSFTSEAATNSGAFGTHSGDVGNFAAFYGTSRALTFTVNEVPT